MSEVGSGQVAIFPTFKGFRSQVTSETGAAGREGGRTFSSAFNAGAGDPGAALVKKLNAQIASGSAALSKARLSEQDAAGKVRVAEAALNEARTKGGAETSRSIAAEERLEAAKRKLTEASGRTKTASDQLRESQSKLAEATAEAGSSGEQAASRYARGWQGLKQRLTGSVKGAVDDAGSAAEASADRAGRSSGGAFGSAFKGALGALAGVFAVDQIAGGFKAAVSAAGDLEQSAGAIQSVFKESSSDMLRWSSTAATSVGLTQNEFNELGTLIGSQLKNGGTAMDELAPKTNELITLGADLSSMFGGTTADAVGALSSALKGETDPIERYGVSLSAAKVEAEAMAMGAKKVDGELSGQAKQAAILSLVMKQTGDAQGNFAKESETLAGQQQRMSAGWKDISAGIGGIFLPILTTVFGFINTSILPVIDSFVSRLGDEGLAGVFPRVAAAVGLFWAGLSMGGGVRSQFAGQLDGLVAFGAGVRAVFDGIAPFFAAFAATWAPLIPTVIGLVSAFSPLQILFAVVQPVLGELLGLFQVLGLTLGTVLTTALTAVTPVLNTLVAALSGILVAIMPTVVQLVGALSEGLVTLAPVIAGVVTQLAPLIASLVTQLAPIITNLVTTAGPMLVSVFGQIIGAIAPLITVIAGLLIPVIQALLPVVVTVFAVIADVITSVMRIVQGVIQVVTGVISGNWAQVWSGILNIVRGVFDLVVNLISGAIQIVMSVILNGLNAIFGFWSSLWSGIVRYLVTSVGSIVSGARGMLDDLVGFFRGIGGTVLGALGNIGGLLLNSGRALIQGFIDGIRGMVGAVGDAVGGVLDFAKQFFPQSPAKRGPFSGRGYTSFSGQALARDFAGGIESEEGTVARAASRLMSAASLSGARATGDGAAASAGAPSSGGYRPGQVNHVTINQVDDPIGTSNAVVRRLGALTP